MLYTGERVIPAHGDQPAQGNYPVHEMMYREFLENGLAANKIVVDVACGCGHGSKLIAERAKKVFAYDISPEAIEFAGSHFGAPNIEYQVQDICSLPNADFSVDLVVSIEVFEHVADIKKAILEVHRVLKERGFWCLTTPNGERYPDHTIIPWHIKHYTKAELHELLDDHFNIYIRETGIEPDSSFQMGWPIFGNYSVFCVRKERYF